jgi:hypothetical protein
MFLKKAKTNNGILEKLILIKVAPAPGIKLYNQKYWVF